MADDPFDLDERTRRLAREWLAEIRKKDAGEEATYKRLKSDDGGGYDGDDGGFWGWLTGDGDGGDAGGDCGGD